MLSTPESDSVSIKSQLWSRDWGSAKYGACVSLGRPGLGMSDNPEQDKTHHYTSTRRNRAFLAAYDFKVYYLLSTYPGMITLTSQTSVQLQVQVVKTLKIT